MPDRTRRRHIVVAVVVAVAGAALGPARLHAALAAAAGTAFEIAPFALLAETVGQRRGRFAAVLGCGCGALSRAASLPAIALCWIAFGPAVALARLGAAIAMPRLQATLRRPVPHAPHEARDGDALASLAAPALAGALTMLAASALADYPAVFNAAGGRFAAFVTGALLGAAAPCATVAVAIAASSFRTLPAVSAGLLATGGVLSLRGLFTGSGAGTVGEPAAQAQTSGFARIALAAALATLALGGPQGFVNPRLVPPAGIGAMLALLGMRRRTRARTPWAIPIVMLIAIAARSPMPQRNVDATVLDEAFAGEALAFTGVAHASHGGTIIQRYAITCCRADAALVAVRTTRRLSVADGSWITVSGLLENAPAGLSLSPARWRRIAPPPDPFVYR